MEKLYQICAGQSTSMICESLGMEVEDEVQGDLAERSGTCLSPFKRIFVVFIKSKAICRNHNCLVTKK